MKKIWSRRTFSLLSELTERFGLLIAKGKNVIPEDLKKKQMLEALHFGHPGSTKMLAENKIFWRWWLSKDIELKCNTCMSRMSSGMIWKKCLPSNKRSNLQVLISLENERINFSGNLHDRNNTDELLIFTRIDRYINWHVFRLYKSTESKEVNVFLESCDNLYGVPQKQKQTAVTLLQPNIFKNFCKEI